MNKKTKEKWERRIPSILMSICIIVLIIIHSNTERICFERKQVCYKTECNFWGCEEIEVDIDSQQCEIKKEECISGYIDLK